MNSSLGIVLLLTIFCYLIFPFIYVLAYGKVSMRKGKKLALWNSIVCAALFYFVGLAIGIETSAKGAMFAPAVLYYFIAKFILIDKNIVDDMSIENEQKNKQTEKSNTVKCDILETNVDSKKTTFSNEMKEDIQKQNIEWEKQKEKDLELLNSNINIKNEIEAAFLPIKLVWELIENGKNTDTYSNSTLCLDSLTPELFIKIYYPLKENNEGLAKDGIYKERPYFTHEILIKMGMYIFKTNNQIKILKYIINSNSSNLIKAKAKEILAEEN